jgi:hypothetical protein
MRHGRSSASHLDMFKQGMLERPSITRGATALVHRKTIIQRRIAMRTILLATTVIAGLAGVSAASAAPVQGAAVIAAQQSKDVIQVANGCGPFWHWSWRWRRCVHN